MDIIKCGTKVAFKLQNIDAIITAVEIRFDNVSYQLSYFYEKEFRTIWVNENEFISGNGERIKIGFK